MEGVEGGTAELRREKRAVHAGRGGAQQHISISKEPLLGMKTPIRHQSCHGRRGRLRGGERHSVGERLSVEDWRKGRRRKAGKLGQTREGVSGHIVLARKVLNILPPELRDIGQVPLLTSRPSAESLPKA